MVIGAVEHGKFSPNATSKARLRRYRGIKQPCDWLAQDVFAIGNLDGKELR
jgi:hypothetical protein